MEDGATMQAGNEKVVSIDYTLTNEDGQVLDTSEGRQPLAYLHGAGNIIPGLEQALTGQEAGAELAVEVAPKDGYGEHDPSLIQPVPRSNFPDGVDVPVGAQFQAQTPNGPRMVTVVEANDQTVTVDGNHPLAGQPLKFQVKIVEVRDATAEEKQHGHVHGPGGHNH